MRARPDLLGTESPQGIEVFQLTEDPAVPSSHVYMEAQIFSPDSRRFVLHRSAHAHGSDPKDPRHQYLLCETSDGKLTPLTTEPGAKAPSMSPDGRWLYYFQDETEVNAGRLTLKRVDLEGAKREIILVLDSPIPGTRCRPSRLYPLSTIRSDGQRLALPAFLGDGQTDNAPWGLLVFDLHAATVSLVLEGPSWCNLHPQYSRSTDPAAMRDILVQENHGNVCDRLGKLVHLTGGEGADIHVIRDDGSDFRDMPWGRDGNEFCQGHQCWRGQSTWAITSTVNRQPAENRLIEGQAAPHASHVGIRTPGGIRNDLSRNWPQPGFWHFGTDREGRRLISDSVPRDGGYLYLAGLGEPGTAPLAMVTRLLRPRSSQEKGTHIHPFLSPDGQLGFFNSDESGILQAYMIRGLENVRV